jgi:hypothetical protein
MAKNVREEYVPYERVNDYKNEKRADKERKYFSPLMKYSTIVGQT